MTEWIGGWPRRVAIYHYGGLGNGGSGGAAMIWFWVAALLELVGCYAFWIRLRNGGPVWWLGAGVLALTGFATALTRTPPAYAGRAFAAYAGIYLVGSLLWLWLVERRLPDRWDLLGSALCLVGTLVILFGRGAGADGGR